MILNAAMRTALSRIRGMSREWGGSHSVWVQVCVCCGEVTVKDRTPLSPLEALCKEGLIRLSPEGSPPGGIICYACRQGGRKYEVGGWVGAKPQVLITPVLTGNDLEQLDDYLSSAGFDWGEDD